MSKQITITREFFTKVYYISAWCLGLDECTEICYKDPVLKDQQWSAYIDRSPGADRYSEFDIPREEVDKVRPKRPPKPPPVPKKPASPRVEPKQTTEDVLSTSA
ncbi:hypothetical protein L484_012093 [Morus notabilis]|uniref:Uncharacterized protein n=1 Tax=Morus notabilis TaxID=981085 RepID=W9RD09_9ROSA|nr:hypothetical protein L484_012093 [Morus notabilis]